MKMTVCTFHIRHILSRKIKLCTYDEHKFNKYCILSLSAFFHFWATVCKTLRPVLLDHCPV